MFCLVLDLTLETRDGRKHLYKYILYIKEETVMDYKSIGHIILESEIKSEANIIGDSNGRLLAEGIMQDLDVKNRNGRIYVPKDIDPDLNSDRIQKELIPTGNMRGEANHPLDKSVARQQVVDLLRAGVVYTKLWRDGNIIRGHFKGANNEIGDYFNKDLASGYKPSFSLRALGSIDNKDGNCYVRNIRIITYDWVILPSHQKAYTTGIITDDKVKTESTLPLNLLTSDGSTNVVTESLIPLAIENEAAMGFIKEESANFKAILENFDVQAKSGMLIDNGKRVMLTENNTGNSVVVSLEDYIVRQFMN